ncbi:MAG TPA: nucleotidyltransferase family protein [Gaiellaceae bacterium]
MTIHAVVLAAGASSRYGHSPPKQQELLPRVLAAVRASSVDDVLVVTGAHAIETDARTVACPDWDRGPGASLRCGLNALPDDAEAALVVLADGPDLDPRALDRVIAAWRYDGGAVYACTYGGVRLHPVLLARAAWPLVPDEGARLLDAHLVECDDLIPPGDVDEQP